MGIKRVDGIQLEKMLKNGLANLKIHEEEINRVNVFPVSDGDTGTNMRFTLENGIEFSQTTVSVGEYLKYLSKGMLLGARGNSGVILSQFFKGLALELARCRQIGVGELRNGLIKGYIVAYSAIVTPVEGTILTVTREGIEHVKGQLNRLTTIEQMLSMYIAEMKKTLSMTPEILRPLKDAGVVDSGALGYITIVEGMLKYLYGDVLIPDKPVPQRENKSLRYDSFNENSLFEDGYCMEFILQLMNSNKYNHHFQLSSFIEDMKHYGNSLIAVQDKKRVKVHIHTFRPSRIINICQDYGEFLTFKLENMQVQHNEHDQDIKKTVNHKPVAVIAVVNGPGMKKLFTDLGCDVVIDGGTTMNTSSKEFLDAFAMVDADKIVVLPNNENIILAAQQAVSLSEKDNVTIIPTKSTAEGYFAIAMDVSSIDDVEFRVREMYSGYKNTVTLCETTASRSYSYNEISCKKGNEILLIDNEIRCVSDNWKQVIIDGLKTVEDIEDRETCIVFKGKGVPDEYEELLGDAVSEMYPNLEVEFVNGGQSIYHWILGII